MKTSTIDLETDTQTERLLPLGISQCFPVRQWWAQVNPSEIIPQFITMNQIGIIIIIARVERILVYF